MERTAAQRRALREFGEIEVIAPEYQTELSLAQSHRTAVAARVRPQSPA